MLNYYGMDKKVIDVNIADEFKLTDEDVKIKKDVNNKDYLVFDFVGFVFQNEKTLSVFPSNYFSTDTVSKINNENLDDANLKRTLADSIFRYLQRTSSRADAISYFGDEIGFESNYPFIEFFNIYKYYITRGLFREENLIIKRGVGGKISWKETLRKSSPIISGGNLILDPIYSWHSTHIDVFISECMAFAINFTANRFSFLFDIKPILELRPSNLLEDTDRVIYQLHAYKSKVFKDIYLNLINNLIDFFTQLQVLENQGGSTHIKIKYFHYIWQDMVTKYLNEHFVSADKKAGITFSSKKTNTAKFEKKTIAIDQSFNNFTLDFDHYAELDNVVLILDSKYYDDVTDLDYKQFTYTQMEVNRLATNNKNKEVISSLVIPTYKMHHYEDDFLLLADDYLGNLSNPVITKLYLNFNELTDNYISNE